MAIKRVFKCTVSNMTFLFKNAKAAHFINYEYHTDNEKEIAELEEEIKGGHPHIYIDDKKKTVDTEADPLAEIKKRAVEEYLAQQKAQQKALDPTKDMGSTEQGKLEGIGTSAGHNSGAAASNSGGSGAQLVATGASGIGAKLTNLKSK